MPDEPSSRPLLPRPTPSRPGSSGEFPHGPSSSRATVPPSEPRTGSRTSFSMLEAQVDRPARVQMIVALILGLVLVAIPLYLWRRPRAESIAVGAHPDSSSALPAVIAATPPESDKPAVGEARILSCQDPGPKKTPIEQCDHVPEFEKAFAKAIEESASCVGKADGGGTIVYVADVSFKRKSVSVGTPKDVRTLKNPKVAAGCERAIKAKLGQLSLEPVSHQHSRYKVSITATYPGKIAP